MGFPVFPLEWSDPETGDVSRGYREDGYFPEAFINLLAFLGWNPGTEQEFFSLDELSAVFDLDRVVKSGSRFDPEKAKWFNKHYFQQKSDAELSELFKPVLASHGVVALDEKIVRVVAEIRERCEFVKDLWAQSQFFFVAPETYDEQTVRKRWKEDTPEKLAAIAGLFATVDNWVVASIKETFSGFMNEKQWGFGDVMNPLRLCLVGGNMGPDLFVICEILGKDETIARMKAAIERIG
jgi:glutamyl-tRNA synthetase